MVKAGRFRGDLSSLNVVPVECNRCEASSRHRRWLNHFLMLASSLKKPMSSDAAHRLTEHSCLQ